MVVYGRSLSMLTEGAVVKYKGIIGIISFVDVTSLSILIKKGQHKSQDCKLVVYSGNFNDIEVLDVK